MGSPFLRLAIAGAIAAMLGHAACAKEVDVWLGTSNAPLSKGIYHATFNDDTGKLGESRLVAEITGPGFLAYHPNGKVLYAVGALNGQDVVAAYAIVKGEGKPGLKFLNAAPIGDGGAAHVALHPGGRLLLTAQYNGGSTAVFSLKEDGSLAARTALIKHEGGANVVPGRQDKPHAHWTGFSPDARFAFVPDLGLDKVVIYKVDAAAGTLAPHGFGAVPPGGGPRHMAFHPNGKWIYVLNELDLSVSLFDYDAAQGRMALRQTVPTVPKAELAQELFSSASEIRVHPSGKFLYAGNRGHDTITAFDLGANGELAVSGRTPVRGATPRNFNLDASGKWLLAAGQDSHTLASFGVHGGSGALTYNRSIIHTPAPICVLLERAGQ